MAHGTVNILGIRIHNMDMRETLRCIETFLEKQEKHYCVFTPNVDFTVKAARDDDFKELLNRADLLVPDGKPLVWAARFLGTPLKEKVAGSDLFFKLCQLAADKGYRVFLLGAAQGVAQIAKTKLQKRYGGLNISGVYSPPMDFQSNKSEIATTCRIISKAKPHLLLVGLGTPKQERFISQYNNACGAVVSIGLGASIDFAAGIRRIPPQWLKKAGFAWLWRLAREPRRLWKRYLLEDMKFFYYILLQKLTKRFKT